MPIGPHHVSRCFTPSKGHLSGVIFIRSVFILQYLSILHRIILPSNVPSKPGMQMRKPWCLLGSGWVDFGSLLEEGP
jgi:hypothetical protein